MADEPKPEQRIAKLLARAGIASRREIERMIVDGRIALDGKVLDTPATLLRSLHGVAVDGQPVAAPPPAQLFLYHKPPGLLVTEHDPAGRPIIYDRLPADLPRLVPVGRLDLATEGLLLLTTDGGLKRQLELPATGVERAYRARTYGEISQERLEELIEGIEIDGIRYGPIDANLERRTGANTWIELILTEGKNREVRRVLEHLGLQVSRLLRTRYGPFLLGDLKPGEIGEVRQHDLVAFRKTLGKPADRADTITVDARTAGGRTRSAPPEQPAAKAARPAVAQDRPPERQPRPPRPTAEKTDRARDTRRPPHPNRRRDAADAQPAPGDARPPRPARTDDRPGRPPRSTPTESGTPRRGRSDRDASRPDRAAPPLTARAKPNDRTRPPRPSEGDGRRRTPDATDRRPPRASPSRSDPARSHKGRDAPARTPRPPRTPGKPPASPRPGGGRGPGKR
ncbi:pseudouridine synthase [uncultured Sphingomonas sp.]|uniref:pseudouridine synthase n=1 Tax=uncultured Sphingomonas sp. TaxID=158754 RepID=UPI0035CC22C0